MQMEYREQARKYVEDRHGDDTDDVTRDVLDRWESVLTRLEGDWMQLSRELDWVGQAGGARGASHARCSTGRHRGCSSSTCST